MTTTFHIPHSSLGESKHAAHLVDAILGLGHRISIQDGEAFTVKQSQDRQAILEALCTTGIDNLYVRNAEKQLLGIFALVWGNDEDGSELVADFTDNEFCNQIFDQVFP